MIAYAKISIMKADLQVYLTSNRLFVKSIDYALFNDIACTGAKFSWNFTRKK
jgi:hypothetical protein